MTAMIDHLLDRTTMYRVVLHYLLALFVAGLVLSFTGILAFDPVSLMFSTVLITATCWIANRVFAWAFRALPNVESVYITALIIALIMDPVRYSDASGIGVLVFTSVWAMASKYIFAIGRKHMFNPAAFGVAVSGLLLAQPATWWVGGNPALLPVVVVGGLLVMRKIRRFDVFAAFALANLAALAATTSPAHYQEAASLALLQSPFFFFAFAMVTEPLTAPQARWPRIAFGGIVGFLASANTHIGSYYFTPEVALLAGNVFAYAASPKGRLMLTLERIEKAAAGAYDFVFSTDRDFAFQPGQYLEWTLRVPSPDSRGNRRYFTIASAPTEEEIRLGVKFYKDSSTFKRALADLRPGDVITASHLAGSFVLPARRTRKLAFIAGGIGITPFRSMVQNLVDWGERRDVVIFYANGRVADFAYADVLARARRELGIRTVFAVSDEETDIAGVHNGFITEDVIRENMPDFRERTFYISGSHAMVTHFTALLRGMGVPRRRIRTDFFPGLA